MECFDPLNPELSKILSEATPGEQSAPGIEIDHGQRIDAPFGLNSVRITIVDVELVPAGSADIRNVRRVFSGRFVAIDHVRRMMDLPKMPGAPGRHYRVFAAEDGEGVGGMMKAPEGAGFVPLWAVYFSVADVDTMTVAR